MTTEPSLLKTTALCANKLPCINPLSTFLPNPISEPEAFLRIQMKVVARFEEHSKGRFELEHRDYGEAQGRWHASDTCKFPAPRLAGGASSRSCVAYHCRCVFKRSAYPFFLETPASSKVAISFRILQAASTMLMARAAPVPSPSRILRSKSGSNPMYS